MPTYQYRCTDCTNELEAVQRFTDPALTECPDCSGQLRKVFSPVGVVFKGSGFYKTDSRSSSNGSNGSSGSSGAKEPAASSSGSSDSGSSSSSSSSSSSTSATSGSAAAAPA